MTEYEKKKVGVIYYTKHFKKYYLVSSFIGDDGKPEHTTTDFNSASVFDYYDRINIANEIRRKGGDLSLNFRKIK